MDIWLKETLDLLRDIDTRKAFLEKRGDTLVSQISELDRKIAAARLLVKEVETRDTSEG